MKNLYTKTILSILVMLVFSTIGFALTTTFNYQGKLNDGAIRQDSFHSLFLQRLAWNWPEPAGPTAIIAVTGTADGTLATLALNTTCDLREAITAANTNTIVGQYIAGFATVDFDNEARPQGAGFEIGADEVFVAPTLTLGAPPMLGVEPFRRNPRLRMREIHSLKGSNNRTFDVGRLQRPRPVVTVDLGFHSRCSFHPRL